jgi:hypothetical protein
LTSSKIFLNTKITNVFNELNDKKITSILVKKSSVSSSEEHTITDKDKIRAILDYIDNLDKTYTPVKKSTVYSGMDYYLAFADDKSPPHYTHINILGNQIMDLRIYNYSEERYYQYRAKVDLTEGEVIHILSEYQ